MQEEIRGFLKGLHECSSNCRMCSDIDNMSWIEVLNHYHNWVREARRTAHEQLFLQQAQEAKYDRQ